MPALFVCLKLRIYFKSRILVSNLEFFFQISDLSDKSAIFSQIRNFSLKSISLDSNPNLFV